MKKNVTTNGAEAKGFTIVYKNGKVLFVKTMTGCVKMENGWWCSYDDMQQSFLPDEHIDRIEYEEEGENKMFTVKSKFYDEEWTFTTREEAEEQIKKFVEEDKKEFDGQDTTNDYYIVEEEM